MNKSEGITVFTHPEFGTVKTIIKDDEPWFVGKEVADVLGFGNSRDALYRHVDEDDKDVIQKSGNTTFEIPTRGLTVINESGLYSLILRSKLPTAKKFKRWVTSEVLPSIRKQGGYIANQDNLSDDELLEKAVLLAQRKLAEREKVIKQQAERIEQDLPKTIFADAVASSSSTILIGDLAKILKQNGYETGQRRLFDTLRNDGFLIKAGASKNMPTQKAMDLKLFEIKESTVCNPDGSVRVTKTTKVTGKGQQFFINRYIPEGVCHE
jgi:anti-repressor protein